MNSSHDVSVVAGVRLPRTTVLHLWVTTVLSTIFLTLYSTQVLADDTLELNVRQWKQTNIAPVTAIQVSTPTKWNARETAVVVCDMWNVHWCRGATARVAEVAPRMNDVLKI